MVTTSHRTHDRSDRRSGGDGELTTLRDVYDSLVGRTRMRAEIINGRLIVSPLGTPEHQDMATTLASVMRSHALQRGWKVYAGLGICADGSRDPYEPDFAVCPPDAPRWGDREVYASGLVMVGEIVSRGSTRDDREDKPAVYAAAGIPVYLLVDPVAAPATVTVLSEPQEGRYTVSATVNMGKEVHIPAPVDFVLDTSVFL